jgi:hypothetical protein
LLQDASFAAVALADRSDVGGLEQPGQVYLSASPVTPYLRDHHGVGP